ncbi:MAG: DNA replication/repair protein RecF [Deltaproteobacteria bacterium]|nr:DNA replication/repair protein RecF [Deltaproteobacteria bacterium]
MVLEQLRLYNFRCYDNAEFRPDPRFNVIVGLNGQGKTSILEAIGLVAFLRSFRNAKNSELTRFDESESCVTAMVNNRDLRAQLAVKIWSNRKQATFNGKSVRFLSEYVGKISAVSFSPTDLDIIRGAPENRRIWCDKISQTFDPEHTDIAVRYQKNLIQRNRILKMVAEGRASRLPDDFEVWTEELCSWGAKMIHNRIHSVDKTVDKIRRYYQEISGENTGINIRYISDIFDEVPCGQQSQVSLELIAQLLRKKLDASSAKEKVLGTTTVGPHRDDLEMTMEGHLARAFASQGEVRSLVLALRLTEVEIYKTFQGLSPILLIDDFSSELDARRRKFLLDYLAESDSQVFLSTTEELQIGKTFVVREGKISSSETIANGYHLTD